MGRRPSYVPKYPTHGKPHPNAGIHLLRDYPRWHWWDSERKKNCYQYVHVWVWEQHHGPVPRGFLVHHINEDKGDYRIGNLELKTKKQHQVYHLGAPVVDGKRTCSKCGETKPLSEFPKRKGGYRTECKECRRAYQEKWSEEHPGYFRKKASEWYKENRDRRNATRRARRRRKAEASP